MPQLTANQANSLAARPAPGPAPAEARAVPHRMVRRCTAQWQTAMHLAIWTPPCDTLDCAHDRTSLRDAGRADGGVPHPPARAPVSRPQHAPAYPDADRPVGLGGLGDEHLPALAAGDGRAFRHRIPRHAAFGGALSRRQRHPANPDRADLGLPRPAAGDPGRGRPVPAGHHRLRAVAHDRSVSRLPHVPGGGGGDHGAEPGGNP